MRRAVKIASFYVVAGLVVFLLYELSVDYRGNRNTKIFDDYSKVIGELEYVNPGNEAFSMSLKYKYSVDGTSYSRIVEIDRNARDLYKELALNRDEVKNIRLWVIYSNLEPSSSLTDTNSPFCPTPLKTGRGFYKWV